MAKFTLTIEYEATEPIYPVDKVAIAPKIPQPFVLPLLRKILKQLSDGGAIVPALHNLQNKSNKRSA